MSAIWGRSRNGNAIDMLDPKAAEVDFGEICLSMADINRYAGAATPAVSVALHTLIGLDIAESVAPDDAEIACYWLAHDMHEGHLIGDITTPCELAIAAIASELDKYGFTIVREAIATLKRRHDWAIYEAAGLPMPTAEQRAVVKLIDRKALATEVRDFMAEPRGSWGASLEGIAPAATVYRWDTFGWMPHIIGHRLLVEVKNWFPCFAPGRVDAAA